MKIAVNVCVPSFYGTQVAVAILLEVVVLKYVVVVPSFTVNEYELY